MSKTPDRRLSICIAADLADKLDEYVSQTPELNRSLAVEQAIKIWLWDSLAQYSNKEEILTQAMKLFDEQQERELYRSYYAQLSDESRAESAAWTEVAEETAAEHWPHYKSK